MELVVDMYPKEPRPRPLAVGDWLSKQGCGSLWRIVKVGGGVAMHDVACGDVLTPIVVANPRVLTCDEVVTLASGIGHWSRLSNAEAAELIAKMK